MAIEKVVKISVDQVQAAGGLEKFTESLNKSEKSATSLRTELKNLKQQLADLPEGTAEYEKVAKRAGEVSDKIGDISTKIKNLGSDTKNIDAVVQGAQTLSGAFTVATSATQLFGVENEDLQKSMAKVEAAIGLTVGIQSIANALQKESALYIGLSNLATKVQIGLQVVYATVVGTTTGALKALRVALVSTGVGALVVGLGYLISKMGESSEATDELTDKQKELNAELEHSKELTDDLSKSIDYYTNIDIEAAKKRGASDKELTRIKLDGIEARGKANLDEINSIKATQKNEFDLTKEQNKRIQQLRKENQDLQRQGNLIVAQYEAEQAQKQRDLEAEKQQKANDKLKADREKYLRELKEFNESVKKGLNDFQIATTEAEFRQRELSIENKQRQIDEMAALGEQNTKNEEAEAAARIAIAKAEAEAKQTSLNGYANAIEQVSGVIGTQTAIGKTIAVASSLINTYAAITGQLKAFSTVSIPGYAIAQAIATGVVGFANVQKILSVKVPNGGGGGSVPSGGSSGGGAVTAPSFNIVGQNSNNQLAQSIANKQSQPVEAYVVSGKMSSAQSLDRNRIDTATFN